MIELIALFSTIILVLISIVICITSFAIMYLHKWERDHDK